MDAVLTPNPTTKSIEGLITYRFKVLKDIDSIRIDAKNMTINNVLINAKSVNFKNNSKELILFQGFKKGMNTLAFGYNAIPKQTLYFIGKDDNLQMWTQGQGRYTSHWLPSFDDVNEKVIFNLSIIYDKKFTVLANGNYSSLDIINSNQMSFIGDESQKVSYYTMKKPMSSYLVMLAIGKFAKKGEQSKSGIPLHYYLDENDKDKFEPTYRYSKQLFDFLETKIGVKYPWNIYRQVPVRDFLYAGMENTTSTIFAQDYVVDEIGFNDRNYINVNAHELAHQWFGDLVTAKSGKHHWLQEGFATYYALLAEKEVFGDDYFYHQLYKTANQLRNAAKTDSIPVLSEKASSLTFYQKGAWALFILKESVGEKAFDKAVKRYLKKYKFKNVETDDFLAEIKKASHFDVDNFKRVWLEKPDFEYSDAIKLLSKNNLFIAQYIEIKKQKELNNNNFVSYIDDYRTLLQSNVYYPIKQEIVNQIKNLSYKSNKDLIELALNSNDIEVRQTVAQSFSKVPLYIKEQYETLLDDKSYDTREIAFVNLWNSFPDDQNYYLEKAQNWQGNNDKSLRILYLTYAQLSKDLPTSKKEVLYQELQNYTSSIFESSIRQNAFEAVFQLNPKDELVLRNLINAMTHFKWRFVSYAREKLVELIKDNDTKSFIQSLLPSFDSIERSKVEKLVN
jgi:aminopeptidase N